MSPKSHKRPDPQAEYAYLRTRFGDPVEKCVTIERKNLTKGPAGFPLSSRRTAEVVLVVPRDGGRILVHTKRFYPAGVWRIPTGGLHRQEAIEAAVKREAMEETGLRLLPLRFLFHIHFRWDDLDKEFQSYGFLLTEASGKIQSRDRREQISAFRDADRSEIKSIAGRLASLRGSWSSWGIFRAAPHQALLEVWPEEGELTEKSDP